MKWEPLDTAPKDGRPVWVKGYNYNDPTKGIHCTWAWFNGEGWVNSAMTQYGQLTLTNLVAWFPT